MHRFCLTIEYDGTNFIGWQQQQNGDSVQQSLSDVIFAYCGEKTIVYGAGRTDSGVHALAQNAHFDLAQPKDSKEIQAALNFHLRAQNKSISIIKVQKTANDFHARFSAIKRHYTYLILNRSAPAILLKQKVWHIPYRLDIDKMKAASKIFIGKHDFTTFRASACQAASPIKTLDTLTLRRDDEKIIIKASAKSFLHHQIRSLVGALVAVGANKLTPTQIKQILSAKDRNLCPQLAPPHGLYLASIDYSPSSDIIKNNQGNVW